MGGEIRAFFFCLAASTVLALGAHGAAAHHSFAAFDFERNVILTGTVKEFQWTNPHAWIEVLVPDGDEQRQWSIEAGSLVMHPLRSGDTIGSLVSVTLADGTVLGPGGAPAPSTGNAPPPQ
jgi:hypothetical protein